MKKLSLLVLIGIFFGFCTGCSNNGNDKEATVKPFVTSYVANSDYTCNEMGRVYFIETQNANGDKNHRIVKEVGNHEYDADHKLFYGDVYIGEEECLSIFQNHRSSQNRDYVKLYIDVFTNEVVSITYNTNMKFKTISFGMLKSGEISQPDYEYRYEEIQYAIPIADLLYLYEMDMQKSYSLDELKEIKLHIMKDEGLIS